MPVRKEISYKKIACCISLLFIFSFYSLQKTGIKIKSAPQNLLIGISINHVPVVVADLSKMKTLLSAAMGFTVKNGRVHAGINNCFTKFSDGSYLEFIQPLDSLEEIGKFYFNFLRYRQGATDMAIDVNSADSVIQYFTKMNITFNTDSNRVWKSISPKKEGMGLFYIEYADKNSKDSKQNTIHANTATGLNAVYFVTNDVASTVKHFCKFGFTQKQPYHSFNQIGYELSLGRTALVIIDAGRPGKISADFIHNRYTGICGLSITVSSLYTLKEQFRNNTNEGLRIIEDGKKIFVLLKNYNLFFEFVE